MLAPPQNMIEAAAKKYLERAFAPGEAVPTDWYRELLGLRTDRQIAKENPKDVHKAIAESQQERLEFMKRFSRFKDFMHEHHGILIDNVYSKGYAAIPQAAQLGVVYGEGIRGAQKAINSAIKRVGHIRVDPVEQSRIRDAKIRLMAVQEAIRAQKRAGPIE